MDTRPAGPRQPAVQHTGDKRTAAYESIFGRPSTSHHNLAQPPSGLNYSASVRTTPAPQPNGQQYLYPTQQQHHHLPQRPTSHSPSAHPQQQQSLYRQSFGQTSQQYQPNSLSPPSVHSRARSLVGAPHTSAVIAPHPNDPIDASLEALTRAGLTPAQAYQAQVYLNSPAGQQSGWNGLGELPAAALRPTSLPTNGPPTRQTRSAIDVPTLGINLDSDGGGLGLDFAGGSPSDPDTDDGSSELPWARPAERTTRGFLFSTQNVWMPLTSPRVFQPSRDRNDNPLHPTLLLLDACLANQHHLGHILSNSTLP